MSAEVFDGYPGLKRTLDNIKPKQRATVMDVFSSSTLKQPDKRDRLLSIEASLIESQTYFFLNNIATHDIAIRDAYTYLQDPGAIQLFPALIDQNDKKHRFHIANTLTTVPFDHLPESAQKNINPTQTDHDFTFLQKRNSWNLCVGAEWMMEDALEDKAVVLVNKKLLVKFNGKLSGVCLETFTTQKGYTFVEGNWYSPADLDSRKQVRNAFDAGKAKLNLGAGSWQLMRPMEFIDEDDLIEDVKDYADTCKKALPVMMDGLPRKQYRMRNEELHQT